MPDMKTTDPHDVEKEEEQDEGEDKPQPAPIKDKKHDSGAADLEKGEHFTSYFLSLSIQWTFSEILWKLLIIKLLVFHSFLRLGRSSSYSAETSFFLWRFSSLNILLILVTDYAEDKEILSTGNELEDAIVAIRKKQEQKKAEKLARERELAKISISKEHVDLIMSEMELPKEKAERTLREHGGDVVKALTALVNAPF